MPAEGEEFPLRMAVSVPKRLYKKAVDRNLLKRRIREAYRLQKPLFHDFMEEAGLRIELVIQYRGREITAYQTIGKSLRKGLDSLKKALESSG